MLVRKSSEKHYKKAETFLFGDSLEKYYLLGRILADGYVQQRKNGYYRWALISKERKTLIYFAERMDLPLYYRTMDRSDNDRFLKDEYDRYRLGNQKRTLAKYLYNFYGDYKEKAYQSFKDIKDNEKISAFLTGYLDGDGSVNVSKKGSVRVVFLCAEESSLKLIKLFLKRLDVYFSVSGDSLKRVYVLTQKEVIKLKNNLYNTEVGLRYKEEGLNKVEATKHFIGFSDKEKQEIVKEIRKKYKPSDDVDFEKLAERYGIAKCTARNWFYHQAYDLNGKSERAKKRKRDSNGRFI